MTDRAHEDRQAPDDVESRLDALSSAAAQRAAYPAMHTALDKVRRARESGDGQVAK